MIELKVKAVSPLMGTKFPLPAYATAGAAAMDLCACMEEPVTLAPGGRQGIPTGIAIALPGPEYVALVCSRSGMGTRHGITLSNGVGVIVWTRLPSVVSRLKFTQSIPMGCPARLRSVMETDFIMPPSRVCVK